MFADDTKSYAEIFNRDCCKSLQDDLNKLSAWSKQWLLDFNAIKCVILRIRESIKYLYTLDGVTLSQVNEQKDLGVLISDNLKPSNHVAAIVKKANQRLGLIKRCFSGLNFHKIDRLFKGIVRPVLEYGSPVWSPWLQKDKDMLEKVQSKCYKLACDYSSHPMPCSLEKRRNDLDLCEVYKLTHNMYKTDPSKFFCFNENPTRGHSYKLQKSFCRTDIRKHFYLQGH